jgi:hypothetical protein
MCVDAERQADGCWLCVMAGRPRSVKSGDALGEDRRYEHDWVDSRGERVGRRPRRTSVTRRLMTCVRP